MCMCVCDGKSVNFSFSFISFPCKAIKYCLPYYFNQGRKMYSCFFPKSETQFCPELKLTPFSLMTITLCFHTHTHIIIPSCPLYPMMTTCWYFSSNFFDFWTGITNCLKVYLWPPGFFWWCPYSCILVSMLYVTLL